MQIYVCSISINLQVSYLTEKKFHDVEAHRLFQFLLVVNKYRDADHDRLALSKKICKIFVTKKIKII
jgi:hypothetical protein